MAHKITSRDQWFLNMRRRDPLQGREFEVGDNVVVCTKCKCVQTYDSWEFNENTCVQCGHNERVDTFSREYIELSYHMDDKPLKKIPGFKVMESDIKYQTDKIRKWFSQQRIARTYKGVLWIYIILLILVMGLSYYWGHDSIEYCVSTTILPLFSNALAKLQYVFEEKLSGFSIVSRLNVDDKIYNLNSDKDEILYKIAFIHSKFILLGTSLLYMARKVVYSFKEFDW